MTPIEFSDAEGLRWTVERRAVSGDAGPPRAVLDLMCETGEHRVYEVLALEADAWEGVNENAWRALLKNARVVDD